MNGTNTKNIGIYDAGIDNEVLVNGLCIKRKGAKAPSRDIKIGDISVIFGEGYKDTIPFQDQLCVAFIDASKDGVTELRGVGYGKETISVEIH